MRRFLIRTGLALFALALVTIGAAAGYLWHLGNEAMHTAEAAGRFNPAPSDAAPTLFEATIKTAFFGRGKREYSLALCPSKSASQTPVVALANAVSYELNGTSHWNRI